MNNTSTAQTPDIAVSGISRAFGGFQALSDVELEVSSGELVALLGPSGSGKTTLLRIIAGLEAHDTGTVEIAGMESTGMDARVRDIGFVFQHYALFKHMSVASNIGFALKMRKTPKERIAARVDELLSLFGLDGLAARYPDELSGGQRQRVALARALAFEPRILLLDEPFGSLDARVRQELRRWLRRLHDDIGVTTLFVTHDQEEALEIADRLVVMNAGRIEQTGTPEEVFRHPANEFVMTFLGNVNIFHARITHGRARLGGLAIEVPRTAADSAKAYVRPHEMEIHPIGQTDSDIPATVLFVNPVGANVKVELKTESGDTVFAEVSRTRYRELSLEREMVVGLRPQSFKIFEDYSI